MMLAFVLAFVCLLLLGVWGLFLIEEKGREKARNWRMGLEKVGGFLLHPGLYYHPGHSWIMPQGGGIVRIGLDDFGRRLVDGIRKVSLPEKGSLLQEGKAVVQLNCGKRRAKLISPVEGVVTDVNEELAEEGSTLERDPYGNGWLFQVQVSDQDYRALPTGLQAMKWLERETDRLSVFLHSELGVTAADGGELIPKPPGMLSEDQWENLVSAFFHSSAKDEVQRGGQRDNSLI
jgi:glycine cleavage system H lipoate-binding protein